MQPTHNPQNLRLTEMTLVTRMELTSAYQAGRVIEFKTNVESPWFPVSPTFTWSESYYYRVKPEAPLDLTTVTTPFGLLDPDTQTALKEYSGEVEFFSYHGEWKTRAIPEKDFCQNYAYRAKPEPREFWLDLKDGIIHSVMMPNTMHVKEI